MAGSESKPGKNALVPKAENEKLVPENWFQKLVPQNRYSEKIGAPKFRKYWTKLSSPNT